MAGNRPSPGSKVVAYLSGAAALIGLAVLLADVALAAIRHLVDVHPGLTNTVTAPVYSYLQHHDAGLNVSTDNLYSVWVWAGALLLIAAGFRSLVGRLGWVAYGSATAAMVWSATTPDSRMLAAGVVVLLWTVASLVAFKGARLPLPVNVSSNVANITSPLPVPVAEPVPHGADHDDVW